MPCGFAPNGEPGHFTACAIALHSSATPGALPQQNRVPGLKRIVAVAAMPLMVTGGIRRTEVAQQVLDSGVAMVGMATAARLRHALPCIPYGGIVQG